jgi:hypothetical protein
LNEQFEKGKKNIDIQIRNTLSPEDYYKTLKFETFQENLQNIKRFTSKNITDSIHGSMTGI